MMMVEFAKVMAYVAAATQKPVSPETVEVYYDLLGDLELGTFQAAAKRVVMEHKWATFPSVAELREAAIEMQAGRDSRLPPQVAWAMAWRAAGQIDPDIRGEFVVFKNGERVTYPSQTDYVLDGLPAPVVATMKTFGIGRLIAADEPIGVIQKQFCETYTGLLTAAKREALLPEKLRQDIDRIGKINETKRIADCRE